MDRDDMVAAIARIETVADRFEKLADKVQEHDAEIHTIKTVNRWVAGVAAAVVGCLIVYALTHNTPARADDNRTPAAEVTGRN